MEDKQDLELIRLKAELYDVAKAYQEATGVIRNVIITLSDKLKVDPNSFSLQELLDMTPQPEGDE